MVLLYSIPLRLFFIIIASWADPEKMSHIVAFHLGLHNLPKYTFRDFKYT